MAGEPDYSQDYKLFDYPQVVTFLPRQSEPEPSAGITVDNALREVLDKGMVGPGGAMLRQETFNFHLPAAQLQGVDPKYGDVIIDADNVRYTIDKDVGKIRIDLRVYRIWIVPVIREQ